MQADKALVRMMPLRLAVLVQDLEFGGTQRYAVNLLQHLDRDLFAAELWVCRRGYDMLPTAERAGIRTTYLSRSSWVGPRALSVLAWKLLRERPQILYTLTVVPNIWGRLIGAGTRVPILISGYRSLRPNQHDRWLWRLSDRIVCNAAASRDELVKSLGVDPRRVSHIPNGVDVNALKPAHGSPSPPLVVSVGRLVEEKDPLTLLESYRLAAAAVPEASFVLIGDGYLRAQAEEFIRDKKLASRIKLLQGTDGVYEHLTRAWVFALASRSESSPNVVIEAMAAGLPVVGTSVGGIPELVDHGKTGLLIEPGNPVRFAEALVSLLKDEPRRTAMGQMAREKVLQRYSIEAMVRETEKVFLEAASEALSRGRLRSARIGH